VVKGKDWLLAARAIKIKPDGTFADEPTGNPDSTTGGKIMKLLFSLNKLPFAAH